MAIPTNNIYISSMIGQIKKKLGLLTIISAISYLAVSVYYLGALVIAYCMQKENCPIGMLLLPIAVWPSLFIFLLKFYIGLQFTNNKFGFNKFIKYLGFLFMLELIFLSLIYIAKALASDWVIVLALLSIIFYSYVFLYIQGKKKELLQYPETKSFYLGFYTIKVSNLFFGSVFILFLLFDLLNIKLLWIKDLPLGLNIFNFAKMILIACMIYPCFWSAIHINKFNSIARRIQLIISSLLIIEIFTGSMFFTLLPIHIFTIGYLNAKNIKVLFSDECG